MLAKKLESKETEKAIETHLQSILHKGKPENHRKLSFFSVTKVEFAQLLRQPADSRAPEAERQQGKAQDPSQHVVPVALDASLLLGPAPPILLRGLRVPT